MRTRALVKKWAKGGVMQDRMATALGISDVTLRKHYRKELDAGGAVWEANFEATIGADVLKAKCPPNLKIFMAKVRLGYREPTPKDPDRNKPEEMSNDELRKLVAERAKRRRAGEGAAS